jgi:multiple RNA-binding domain-containing protein 1
MSRVRILNLPQSITEPELRRHLVSPASSISTSRGTGEKLPDLTITDVFIVKNKLGAVRMAFVGFKTTAAASCIVKHYNGTFLGSLKLKVEPALGVQDATEKFEEKQAKLKKKEEIRAEISKRQADEAHNDVAGGKARRKRAREGEVEDSATSQPAVVAKGKKKGMSGEPGENSVSSVGIKGVLGRREDMVEQFVADRTRSGPTYTSEVLAPIGQPMLPAPTTAAEEESLAEKERRAMEKQQALGAISDLDFLQQLSKPNPMPEAPRTEVKNASSTGSGSQFGMHGQVDAHPTETEVEPPKSEEALARSTRRVWVRNLPFVASEADVKNFFSSQVGPLEAVHLPLTRDTKQSKGVAFIRFYNPEDAVKALQLSMTICMGRLIKVVAAELNPKDITQSSGAHASATTVPGSGSGLGHSEVVDHHNPNQTADEAPREEAEESYKAKKARERKAAEVAGKANLSWNPMFMATSTAVTTMAKRMNVNEKDLVSVNAAGAAVRAAVAEAVLTTEARRVLSEEGIDFARLDTANSLHRNRSNTTILVKNLAAGVSISELTQRFKKFGPLETIAVPKDPTFAIFAFIHAQDARAAFQRLSYSKMNGTLLLLEWAPVGCLKDDVGEDGAEDETNADAGLAPSGAAAFTAYVTNIPFGTNEEKIRIFLQDSAPRLCGEGMLQRVDYLPEKGQAFITVKDDPTLRYVVAKLQGRTFEGRTIGCQVSKTTKAALGTPAVAREQRTVAEGPSVPEGCDPCKLIVKNLPFEATEADLRQLFASFSEVKSVRVPKKNLQFTSHRSNNHRGFGFVEFLSRQEAANALQSLSNTHLYGRHLVLQYAQLDKSGLGAS